MADTYDVVGQKKDVEINPAGNGFMNVWHVTYQPKVGPHKGQPYTITVSEADHNAKYIDQAIRDDLKNLNEIGTL